MKLNFFIGYDSKEDIAYRVCKYSLLKRTNADVNVMSLKLDELIAQNLYTRSIDPLASTQFTYSRFLVPKLTNYEGWAVFCDCDFIFLGDVSNLFKNLDENKAVYCVKHDYTPKEKHKMDGQKQTIYPRKNWSSLMMFNCSHIDCQNLSIKNVNTKSAKYLHRMNWTSDKNIGEIPPTYNWLEGWYEDSINPKVIHYTRGAPIHDSWNGSYSNNWIQHYEELT